MFISLITLILSILIFYSLLYFRSRLPNIFFDFPNERSSHFSPTLKIGGLVVFGMSFYVWFFQNLLFFNYFLPILLIFLISLIDDFTDTSVTIRIILHFVISLFFLIYNFSYLNYLIILFFLISLVWVTNFINFMDGINGLAAFLGIIGLSSFSYLSFNSSYNDLFNLSFYPLSPLLSFLIFNYPFGKFFLGDNGATTIGFLSGMIGLLGWKFQIWPIWFPVLIYFTYGFDATFTVILRTLNGDNSLKPHKEFLFHKMVSIGFNKNLVTFIYVLFSLINTFFAFFLINKDPKFIYIYFSGIFALSCFFYLKIHNIWKKNNIRHISSLP
jgi:UDP-N-acetylmuramyl pentapeptide phosphotransferase/UDP-N-acetylglucosamine-1-phosphate transferase